MSTMGSTTRELIVITEFMVAGRAARLFVPLRIVAVIEPEDYNSPLYSANVKGWEWRAVGKEAKVTCVTLRRARSEVAWNGKVSEV